MNDFVTPQAMTQEEMGENIQGTGLRVLIPNKNEQEVQKPRKQRKWKMEPGDEYVEHKWVQDGDKRKRVRVIKRHRTTKLTQ